MVSQQTDSAVGQLANQMGGGMHTTDNAATTQIADDPWLPVEFNPFANLHPCHIAGQIKHLPDLISIERIVETFSAAENDNSFLNDPTQSIAPLKRYRLNTRTLPFAFPCTRSYCRINGSRSSIGWRTRGRTFSIRR
jgi:hypothetical protein